MKQIVAFASSAGARNLGFDHRLWLLDRLGEHRPRGRSIWRNRPCFTTLLLTYAPLSLALLVMLRYAVLLRASAVAMTGGLAVAAITATTLSLLHQLDATAMILVWNAGIVTLIAGLGGVFGRRMFRWTASHLVPTHADALRA
jgi:hypothetical protein